MLSHSKPLKGDAIKLAAREPNIENKKTNKANQIMPSSHFKPESAQLIKLSSQDSQPGSDAGCKNSSNLLELMS